MRNLEDVRLRSILGNIVFAVLIAGVGYAVIVLFYNVDVNWILIMTSICVGGVCTGLILGYTFILVVRIFS